METLEELMRRIEKICTEELGILTSLSELPKTGGLYAEMGMVTTKRYVRSASVKTVQILFMCKDAVEPVCIRNLSKVSGYLQKNKRKLEGEGYRVRSVKETSGPHKTGRTESKETVYSCILYMEIY